MLGPDECAAAADVTEHAGVVAQRARNRPQHGDLDRQPLMTARHHLGRVAARNTQQVVTRLRFSRQKFDPDASLRLRAVLAGTTPRDLTADQRRASTAAEADRDDDNLTDRERPPRRIKQPTLTQ